MAQHDFNIANQTAPSFRSDLNNALSAAATNSSGSTAPSTLFGYMFWYDTSTNKLKINNSGTFVSLGTLDTVGNTFKPDSVDTNELNLTLSQSFSSSGNCGGTTIVSYDAGIAYGGAHLLFGDFSITNSGGGTSTIRFQASPDNVTYTNIQTVMTSSTTNGVTVSVDYDNIIGAGPTFRYFRVYAVGNASHTFTADKVNLVRYRS